MDYRTPFWRDQSRETVLQKWADKLESLRAKMQVPGLIEFEEEMRTKVGPLSVQLPLKDRVESIEHYYTLIDAKSEPIVPEAIEATKKAFAGSKGVRLRSIGKVIDNMRLNTNSGTPYFTKRRHAAVDTFDALSMSSKDMLDPTVLDGYRNAAILGWRGQEGGPETSDVKQRVVWMMPFGLNAQEGMAYQPLITAWQKAGINSAYISFRAVEEKITRLFDTKGDEYVVVTDFSKFDQHFNRSLQDAASEIIADQLQSNGWEKIWMEHVFPYKYEIPLICSDELMYTGFHGMASGSTGTNFDECCAHTAMQHECAILNGATLNPYSNAYGDDGYLSFKGIDVDKVISTYTSHGQEMNPTKQSVDKHSAVYLRRYFHDSYRDSKGIMLGIYSTYRALGRLLGQERYFSDEEVENDYKSLVELRAYSILENCNNHPCFTDLVDFVMDGDRYRLGLSIPGFLDSLGSIARKFTARMPDLLGYTKSLQNEDASGIENWKVVQYLKSKL